MSEEKQVDMTSARIFHHLSAGATTIMPSGKVIRFGGSIKQGDNSVTVGRGTYITKDVEEIAWLENVSKQPSPQIWEEVNEQADEVPEKVMQGSVQDATTVADQLKDQAAAATGIVKSSAVETAMNKLKANAGGQ